MRIVYEREKRLRESASVVFLYGDTVPKRLPEKAYVESATAARLRAVYELGEPAWW